MKVRPIILFAMLTLALSGCREYPYQQAVHIKITDGAANVDKLVAEVASKLDAEVSKGKFEYGGPNGTSLAYEVWNDDTKIILQSESDSFCTSDRDPANPTFAKDFFVAQIASVADQPKQKALAVIETTVETHKGRSWVNDEDLCRDEGASL